MGQSSGTNKQEGGERGGSVGNVKAINDTDTGFDKVYSGAGCFHGPSGSIRAVFKRLTFQSDGLSAQRRDRVKSL